MGKISNKKSEVTVDEVSNSSSNAINRDNVIVLIITNDTGFEVTVKEKRMGSIRIGAGKKFEVWSYPCCPFDVSATVTFNAAAPNTDYITFTINSVGNEFQTTQC